MAPQPYCRTCGRQHPPIQRLQAMRQTDPVRSGCLHWLNAALVSVLIIIICIWALSTVLA